MPEPTVRTGDETEEQESDSLVLLLADATRAVQRVFSERIRDIGVSSAHWPCLRVLCKGDGITQHEIADRAKIADATLVPVVRWLEMRGYLVRRSDIKDRRKMRIFLTGKGRETCERVMPEIRAINTAAAKSMSDAQLQQLKRSLQRMRLNVLARDW
ncbi:MAG: MarR family transcriptional regulator [Betaproteobacteria bacterium]|nr:MarR family transcriptional regulator [Betaproteobacteria bacterium]